ncbi:hypothetical protein Ancab_022426 [Ancistrocladus abbreviatus]
MGTHLQQLLRNLCFKTEWDYAVFWKLKHCGRMVLTWEDAYYSIRGKDEPVEIKSFSEVFASLHDGHLPHDPLGLAMAKMSYHVYSLGEGIVGQVAVTGKHKWILIDDQSAISCSSSEHSDGWQAQFLAGIQTIVVVAVVPHGVVLVGSLNKVDEDINLVNHIREVFSALQDSITNHVSDPIRYSLQSLVHSSETSVRSLASEVLRKYLLDLDGTVSMSQNIFCCTIPSLQKQGDESFGVMSPVVHLSRAAGLIRKNGQASSTLEGVENANMVRLMCENQESISENEVRRNDCKIQNTGIDSRVMNGSSLQSSFAKNNTSYDTTSFADKSGVEYKCSPLDLLESASRNRVVFDTEGHHPEGLSQIPLSFEQQLQNDTGKNMESESEFSSLDSLTSSFKYSAGYELHEALGPAFLKQNYPLCWEVEQSESGTSFEIPEAMENNMLTTDSGSDHLLEAVVANFCSKNGLLNGGKSWSTSADSLLTAEKMHEPSTSTNHAIGSRCYSIDCSSLLEDSTQHCLNSSESYSVMSSNGFTSLNTAACKEQLMKPIEQAKGSKKKARPGESCRPRPRDRQLIQDRIRELRELVPNGSKQCSIDSLLERTIKHMLFLQSITKHADKLNNSAKSRVPSQDVGILGCSSYEQGSSWAVEVGGQMKVGPIMVENLNTSGQLLIELLCEGCDHFLEITEAIRGLGLNILKGITEGRGEKTWMHFIVEVQNNRSMHRMDVLWSLVQILQAKAAI